MPAIRVLPSITVYTVKEKEVRKMLITTMYNFVETIIYLFVTMKNHLLVDNEEKRERNKPLILSCG
jgi:hypothetical protein